MNVKNVLTAYDLTGDAVSYGLSFDVDTQEMCLVIQSLDGESIVIGPSEYASYFVNLFEPTYREMLYFHECYPTINNRLMFDLTREIASHL